MGKSLTGLPQSHIDRVQLPALYVAARAALQACARIDEVKDLQDKHDAIAIYAKQSQNRELQVLARRISLRAERRLGQLLLTIAKASGPLQQGQGRGLKAERAGVKKGQVYRALKFAGIPEAQFEAIVESEDPPHRERLAKTLQTGKALNLAYGHRMSTVGALRAFVRYWDGHAPEDMARLFSGKNRQDLLVLAGKADDFLTRLRRELTLRAVA